MPDLAACIALDLIDPLSVLRSQDSARTFARVSADRRRMALLVRDARRGGGDVLPNQAS